MGTVKVSTVAGGYVGSGIPATEAVVSVPYSTVQDKKGNYYVTDRDAHRIRKITPGGTITTFAGTGICGYNGDNIKSTKAMVCYPSGMAFDSAGNLYVADSYNQRSRPSREPGVTLTTATAGRPPARQWVIHGTLPLTLAEIFTFLTSRTTLCGK
jgi:hypothetical protein